ncbi:MAG: hypothetical protein ACTHWA_05115 [Arachnia sp.]
MNEHELTDAFEDILPEQPSTKGWAGVARRRRQRKRAWVGAAVVALVAAAAIPVGLGLGSSSTQVQATPAVSATERLADDQCITDADGTMATTDLPNGDLPDGPEAVWMCTGIESRAPSEPLVGPEATQHVVDGFNDLSETPINDSETAVSPIDGYLVITYPDGQRYAVHADFYKSMEVRWGSEQQNVRYGTYEWLRGLQNLWVQQRNDTPQMPPLEPTVGVCENQLPGLGREIEHYDIDGALCRVVRAVEDVDGYGLVEGVEIPAPAEVFEAVLAEAQNSRTTNPRNSGFLSGWNGDAIMLVDDYGDRLPLWRVSDTTWTWQEGDNSYEFTPSAELDEQLRKAFDLE